LDPASLIIVADVDARDLLSFPTRRSSDLSTPEKERILKESFDNALELMRTPLFNNFEETFRSFFVDQIKRTTHQIRLDFRTFTPDRKSTRLNSSHVKISYAVFCLNKKNKT